MSRYALETETSPQEMAEAWEKVLLGDKELFKEMTEPYLPTLMNAARRSIRQENLRGRLLDRLDARELVGETLLQAWPRRYNRADDLSLKHWLLRIQHWTLYQIVVKELEWKKLTSISLETPVPKSQTPNNENEWPPADDEPQECWRDIIPNEVSLTHVSS